MGAGDALDDRQAQADAVVVVADAFAAALERFGEGRDQLRWELARRCSRPRAHRAPGRRGLDLTPSRVRGGCGRWRCGRGSWSSAAGARASRWSEPRRPDVSTVTPRASARGSSVSAASSAMRDRSTAARLNDRWSARLSRSSASVRSIARVLTTWRRSMSSPSSRSGSLRATSSSVCVIASGVRSSWDAFAANRCCSATCASSRASMASKASASSRNSSLRPASRIRWESDPFAAMRVASVMRVRGASIRPARIHPPTRPKTSRNASTAAASRRSRRRRSERFGDDPTEWSWIAPSGT